MAHNILLAGLGRIGATYDIEGKENHVPRSHLGAIQANQAFRIAHLVDPNDSAFLAVQKHWNLDSALFVKTLSSLKEQCDVCVFATHPNERIEELEFSLNRGAKVIIFEKPLSRSYDEAKRILDIWKKSPLKPHVLVNFTRRFDQRYQSLKNSLDAAPDRIVCYYSKGLENYASHHIDLVQDWFGEIESVQAFGDLEAENPDFLCSIKGGLKAVFIGVPERDYDVFDMQLWFKDKRIDIVNGGTEIRRYLPHNDLYYNNYTHLVEEKSSALNGLVSGITGLYERVRQLLSDNNEISSADSLKYAVNVMKVIEAVKQSVQNNGKTIKLEDI